MTIEKRGRHWAVYAGDELVCLTVYKRGAQEVIRRLGQIEDAVLDNGRIGHDGYDGHAVDSLRRRGVGQGVL